ncbi:MAG: hypothetical protein HKN76_16335 [Saprospiraceae bacterium]|nr:hypothetical protein [Saprospiraceae bacterium]
MDQQVNIDLIEQYLTHEMSEAQRVEFEDKLKTDEALAAEFERRKTAHKMIDFMVTENLRSQLKSLESKDAKIVSLQSRKRRMYTLAIAASFIILLGAFFMLMPGGSDLSRQQLAMEYYASPDFTLRSGADVIPAGIAEAVTDLRSNNLNSAIATLEQIEISDPYYVLAQYYLGHAQFLSEDFSSAQASFQRVADSNDLRYLEDAQWYALLSCLSAEGACTSYMNAILNNPDHNFYQQTIEIQQR